MVCRIACQGLRRPTDRGKHRYILGKESSLCQTDEYGYCIVSTCPWSPRPTRMLLTWLLHQCGYYNMTVPDFRRPCFELSPVLPLAQRRQFRDWCKRNYQQLPASRMPVSCSYCLQLVISYQLYNAAYKHVGLLQNLLKVKAMFQTFDTFHAVNSVIDDVLEKTHTNGGN
jgi:hypothetical protein